jgi:CRP-like cAMP-binding protein
MSTAQIFTERLLYVLQTEGVQKTLSKGEFLLREGDVEKNLYYIESGAVRAFLLSEFEEQTIRFGYEGSIINSLSSYITGKPSEFYIEAMRKSSIRVLPKEAVLKLVHKDTESLQGYVHLLEAVITQQIDRENDLLTVSPTERLKRVLQRSPTLFQEVPLKYIASYLRMTPETLSRVRNP